MLKRLSIFFIFIFFISTFGVTFHHHEDVMLHDDCLVCSLVAKNRAFLTQDTYQVLSNDRAISTVLIDKYFITPCTLTRKFSARSPPA